MIKRLKNYLENLHILIMIDLFTAISLIILAGGFFTLGYWVGSSHIKGAMQDLEKIRRAYSSLHPDVHFDEKVSLFDISPGERVYPEIHIFNEPSGVVYRPTALELKKMNEDQVTKEVKAAMKETFDNAPEVVG